MKFFTWAVLCNRDAKDQEQMVSIDDEGNNGAFQLLEQPGKLAWEEDVCIREGEVTRKQQTVSSLRKHKQAQVQQQGNVTSREEVRNETGWSGDVIQLYGVRRSDKSLGTHNRPICEMLLAGQTGSITILDGCGQSGYSYHMPTPIYVLTTT